MIKLSKIGGDVKIEYDDKSLHLSLAERRTIELNKKNPDDLRVNIEIGPFKRYSVPLNELTIADEIPTTEEEFDTQKALVFAEYSALVGRFVELE